MGMGVDCMSRHIPIYDVKSIRSVIEEKKYADTTV
jgi:hypothetical protein